MTTDYQGLYRGTITPGVGQSMEDNSTFWLLGRGEEEVTSLYHDAKDARYMYSGAEWPGSIYEEDRNGRVSHCAVNINFNNPEYNNQVVVIGGIGSDMDEFDDRTKRVITYCTGSGDIDKTICNIGSQLISDWSVFPSLVDSRSRHSCTVFNVEGMGQTIIVNGGGHRSAPLFAGQKSPIFFIEKCGLSGEQCSWMSDADGMSLEFVNIGDWKYDGEMVTLDNVPTYLGGSHVPGYSSNGVYQFKKNSSSIYEWTPHHDLRGSRHSHAAVSVPLEFLC